MFLCNLNLITDVLFLCGYTNANKYFAIIHIKGKISMKIALFRELPLSFPGGVTHVMNILIKYLVSNGHEVLLFVPDSPVDNHLGAKVVSMPSFHFPFLKNTKFRLVKPVPAVLEEKLRLFKPDIIHILHPITLGLAGMCYGEELGVPVVCSYHTQYHLYLDYYKMGILKKLMWFYTRWVFNKCDINIAPCESVAQMMKDGGINRIGVWGRGVDSERFSPKWRNNGFREKYLQGNPNSKIILYVGRLYKEKNLRKIISEIKNIDNTVFMFAGDGPERKYLSRILPADKTVFLGRVENRDLSQVYASADIFLFPSKTEGCPNVVMEAVASGLPVIAVDAYGVKDIVQAAQCGFLYPDGEEICIKPMLDKLICNDTLRQTLSANARKFAESKTWDSVMDVLIKYYKQAMKTGRIPGLVTQHRKNDILLKFSMFNPGKKNYFKIFFSRI